VGQKPHPSFIIWDTGYFQSDQRDAGTSRDTCNTLPI
jgi:hypothetical protein